MKKVTNKFLRLILIVSGVLCIGLGILGIILPILPTTPFILLAAALFARSSPLFYNWIIKHKWFGSFIKNYYEGKGIPTRVKITAISILWITILFSVFFAVKLIFIKIALILIAVGASIYIISIKPRRNY